MIPFLCFSYMAIAAQVTQPNLEVDGTKENSGKQSKRDSLRTVYPFGFDTNYVKRYNDRLAVSIFQSQRTFDLRSTQTFFDDPTNISKLNFIARSNKATGITIAYDKISLSLAYATPIPESEIARKGKTKYSDYSFSFTSYRYRVELSYRNYKGFYEDNTANYDSTFNDTSTYFKRPDMNNLVLKSKFIYFFNKRRFSYNAVYNNTYRQMKSAGSFFAYSDLFYNSVTDPAGFFPTQVDSFYSNYKRFNDLRAGGITIGGGYSINIVIFKSLYVNGTIGIAAQFYQQNTRSADGLVNNHVFKAGITSSDVRGAIGYNGKNFFIRATIAFDNTVFAISKIQFRSQLIGGSFAYGYRFKFKERNWVKKMKNHKLYKIL